MEVKKKSGPLGPGVGEKYIHSSGKYYSITQCHSLLSLTSLYSVPKNSQYSHTYTRVSLEALEAETERRELRLNCLLLT